MRKTDNTFFVAGAALIGIAIKRNVDGVFQGQNFAYLLGGLLKEQSHMHQSGEPGSKTVEKWVTMLSKTGVVEAIQHIFIGLAQQGKQRTPAVPVHASSPASEIAIIAKQSLDHPICPKQVCRLLSMSEACQV